MYFWVRQNIGRAFIRLRFLNAISPSAVIRCVDVALIIAGCAAFAFLYHRFSYSAPLSNERTLNYALLGVCISVLYVISSELSGLYRRENLVNISQQVRGITASWLFSWVFFGLLAFAVKASADFSRIVVITLALGGAPVLLFVRLAARRWLEWSSSAQLLRERVAVLRLGSSEVAGAGFFKQFRIIAMRDIPTTLPASSLAEQVGAFIGEVAKTSAKRIFVCVRPGDLPHLRHLKDAFRTIPLPVSLVTDDWVSQTFMHPVTVNGKALAFEFQGPPLSLFERFLKRSLDIVVAGTAVLLLSPLLALVALAVRLDSPGPMIFRQRRLGFNGREFNILKFRSMTVTENDGAVRQASRNDQRVTKVGRFIRATSLDELPQLINVLRGEMSLVGPRPHAVAHDEYYDKLIADYSLRRHMKPGLTGWAQVNGFRGETPTLELMEARVAHDLWYVNNWSIWVDLTILVKTAYELVRNKDVY